MEKINPIYLTSADLKQLRKKEIGYGTDGVVCQYGKKELVKLYHRKLMLILENLDELKDEVKIYEKGNYKSCREPITAMSYNAEAQEYIKVRAKQAIKLAMQKQKNVTLTNLPKNMVYVENIFAGCLLERARGIEIHRLSGLPFKYRKIIMQEIIESVRELLANNIYHIDLDNSPFARDALLEREDGVKEQVGHSHVLVDLWRKKANIIDLDGISTIYTENYSEEYEALCLFGLCRLLVYFFFQIDNEELNDYEHELDVLAYYLENARVGKEYIDKLSRYSLNIDEVDNLVKTYTLK